MAEQPERPVALTVLPENIPDELKALYIWVVWRYEWNERRQRWTKVPYTPFTTSKASSTRESSWRSFQAAHNCYLERRDFFDGIFACLSEKDPYAGGDFDHTDDRSRIPQTYAEDSPSETGYRFIGRGSIPSACKKPNGELYDRKRFLSITGHILPGFPREIRPIQPELDKLYEELKGAPKETKEGNAGRGSRAEQVKQIPVEWWDAGRDIMRTGDRNRLLARLRAAALNKTTRKPDTQLALAMAGEFNLFNEKYPYVGIVRADGSIDESQVRAVVAEGIRIRRFSFPEYTALMSHFFAADYLDKHKSKERWREELAALWFRSRAPREGEYIPAVVEPVARGRASDHAETLERAYQILISFKAGAEALLTVQDLADALGASRRTASGVLAELEAAERITSRQAGQYGGLVVTFSGMQISGMQIDDTPHTENSNGYHADDGVSANELSGMQIEISSMPVLQHKHAESGTSGDGATTANDGSASIYIYNQYCVSSPVNLHASKTDTKPCTIDQAVIEAYDNLPRSRLIAGGELKKWPITVQRVREYVDEHYPGQWPYEAVRYRIEQVKKKRKAAPFDQMRKSKREVLEKKSAAVRRTIERFEHLAETHESPEARDWYGKRATEQHGRLGLIAWELGQRETADAARIAANGYTQGEQQEFLELVERERRDTVLAPARSDALSLVERLQAAKVRRQNE